MKKFKRDMTRTIPRKSGFAWLELLLVLAVLSLVLQLVPSWGQAVMQMIDVRTYTRSKWFWLNTGGVLTLVALRFWPELVAIYQARQTEHKKKQAESNHQRELREQRELYARMNKARKRQV